MKLQRHKPHNKKGISRKGDPNKFLEVDKCMKKDAE